MNCCRCNYYDENYGSNGYTNEDGNWFCGCDDEEDLYDELKEKYDKKKKDFNILYKKYQELKKKCVCKSLK